MYKLFFEFPDASRVLVSEHIDEKDIVSKIYEDMALHNPDFKIYYVRSWIQDGNIIYDYGSYVSFYVAIPNT